MINYFCCVRCATGLRFKEVEMRNEHAEKMREILHGRGEPIETLPLAAAGSRFYRDSCSICEEKFTGGFVQWQMRDDVYFVTRHRRFGYTVRRREWDTPISTILEFNQPDAEKLWKMGVERRDGYVLITHRMAIEVCAGVIQ